MPMTLVRILSAILLAVAAGVATPVPVACACSCAPLDTAEAMERASAVFEGEVVATSRPTTGHTAELIEYTLEVSRVYRGAVPARVVVRSAVSSASCGAELAGQVTVFAHGPVGDLQTTLCSAPVPIDRSRLGTGQPPAAAPTPTPTPESLPATGVGPLVVGTLAGLGVLTGAVAWLVRRARR